MSQLLKNDRRSSWLFTLIIVAVHTGYYLLAMQYKHIFNGDSFEYIQEAANIQERFFFYSGNRVLPLVDEYKTLRTPLYPLGLALIYKIQVNNWLVLLFQNLLSVWNMLYFRKILLENGGSIRFPWLLLIFLVGFPSQFLYANTIAPEILLQTFTLIYFRNAFRFLIRKSGRAALWMSIALLLGLFTKPVLYPFAAVHVFLLIGYGLWQKNSWRSCTLAALLPVAGIMLYSWWNLERTGKYHFSSIQSFNAIFYYNNYFQAVRGQEAAQLFLDNEKQKIAQLPTFPQRYDYAHARGWQLLRENFADYALYHLKRSLLFYLEPGKGEIDLFTGRMTLTGLYTAQTESFRDVLASGSWQQVQHYIRTQPTTWLALIILGINLVKCAGVLLFFWYARVHRWSKLFLLLGFTYFALITGPIAAPHYVLPVSLLFAGCAVRGFAWWQSRRTILNRPLSAM